MQLDTDQLTTNTLCFSSYLSLNKNKVQGWYLVSEVFHPKSSLKEETNLTETNKDPRVRKLFNSVLEKTRKKTTKKKITTFVFGNNRKMNNGKYLSCPFFSFYLPYRTCRFLHYLSIFPSFLKSQTRQIFWWYFVKVRSLYFIAFN